MIAYVGLTGYCFNADALPRGDGGVTGEGLPLFFLYDFDFYREHVEDYSYYEHGHLLGAGVNATEILDVHAAFGFRDDSEERFRKWYRLGLTAQPWSGVYINGSVSYQERVDNNPKYVGIFDLFYEHGIKWTVAIYDEFSAYWEEDNYSNSLSGEVSYLVWPERWLFLHCGGDVEHIKNYNDYFRRIEWQEGDEDLRLLKARIGMSKYLWRDVDIGVWRLRGDFEADSGGVYYGVASSEIYYDFSSLFSIGLYGSAAYDTLRYDVEMIYANVIISPF